jgi:hypothetical protein
MVEQPDAQFTNSTPLYDNQLFTATVTDSEGNTASVTIEVVVIPGPNVIENQLNKTKVYPNPNNGCFTIEGEVNYQLINGLGQTVLSGICHDKAQIDAQGLQQGVYFLRLSDENGSRIEKLVIEK